MQRLIFTDCAAQRITRIDTGKGQRFRMQQRSDKGFYVEMQRLVNLIRELSTVEKARRATRPTRASKERRLEGKSRRSTTKSMRGKVQ